MFKDIELLSAKDVKKIVATKEDKEQQIVNIFKRHLIEDLNICFCSLTKSAKFVTTNFLSRELVAKVHLEEINLLCEAIREIRDVELPKRGFKVKLDEEASFKEFLFGIEFPFYRIKW